MTQFLQLRSGNAGAPFLGVNDLDTLLWDNTQKAWYVGPGGGAGAVLSVFGRFGAVVAATGDYDGDQVDNVSSVPGASLSDALEYLLANAGAVGSVFGRVGAVLAATGDYDGDQVDNVSGVPGASLSDALDYLLANAGAVGSVFGRTGLVVAMTGDYTATQINAAASGVILGRFAAGAGAVQEGAIGGSTGLEVNATNNGAQVASRLGSRTTENVAMDLYPSVVNQGAINNGGTADNDFTLTAARRYMITANVWVNDGAGGACLYMKEVRVIATVTAGISAMVGQPIVSAAPLEAQGFTFTAAVVPATTKVRFTLANTSGTNRTYNVAIGAWDMDLP